jgi:sugar phosphate isomerase/epimerase
MDTNHAIKRGVSLYSYQEEYFLRKMMLEDLLATSAELDIPGIEIIGEQMIPGYPYVPDTFFDQWHGWMEKYGLTPVCLDMFLYPHKFKGRVMTKEEMVASVVEDIKFANRLGCSVVRVQHNVSIELLEALVPYAEQYDVKLGVEIHAPFHLDHPFEQELVAAFQRVGSPYLGFVLDLGIYTKRFARIISNRWLRMGMKPEIADYIVDAYHSGEMADIGQEVAQLGGTQDDIDAANLAKYMIYSDPRRVLDYMPYIFHVHGKFSEMLPDYTDYSIPYEEIIPVLIEGGFDGYIASEYEGNWYLQDAFEVDSVEQVRRHQVMLKRLLGET